MDGYGTRRVPATWGLRQHFTAGGRAPPAHPAGLPAARDAVDSRRGSGNASGGRVSIRMRLMAVAAAAKK